MSKGATFVQSDQKGFEVRGYACSRQMKLRKDWNVNCRLKELAWVKGG